jgi:hypothetical protein
MKSIPYWKIEQYESRPATACIGLGRAEVEVSLPGTGEVPEPCLLVEAAQEAEDCYHSTRLEYLLPIEMLKQLLLEHGYELTKKEAP